MAKKQVSDNDKQLFRQATAGVKPLSDRAREPRPDHRRTYQSPAKQRPDLEKRETVNTLANGDSMLSFRRSGVSDELFRKLANGRLPIDDELDLHGLNEPRAQQLLLRYIHGNYEHGAQCVLVIHGKGQRANGNRPILKNLCNDILRRLPEVTAFTSARIKHGGSGALYVLLNTTT